MQHAHATRHTLAKTKKKIWKKTRAHKTTKNKSKFSHAKKPKNLSIADTKKLQKCIEKLQPFACNVGFATKARRSAAQKIKTKSNKT